MNNDSNPAIGGNYLAALADDLRALQAGIQRNAKQVATDAVEAGRKLIEARIMIPHGQWEPWLAANVPTMSARTARRYMTLARSGLEIGHVADLGINAALREIAGPERDEAATSARAHGWPPLPLPLLDPPAHGELISIVQERRNVPQYPISIWLWQSVEYPGFHYALMMEPTDDGAIIEGMAKPIRWEAIGWVLHEMRITVHDTTEAHRHQHSDPAWLDGMAQFVAGKRSAETGAEWRKRQWESDRQALAERGGD
jgi:hypothetical protein